MVFKEAANRTLQQHSNYIDKLFVIQVKDFLNTPIRTIALIIWAYLTTKPHQLLNLIQVLITRNDYRISLSRNSIKLALIERFSGIIIYNLW